MAKIVSPFAPLPPEIAAQFAKLAAVTGRLQSALEIDALTRYSARETGIVAAIARGQEDVLASRVTPNTVVAGQARVTMPARAEPAERAVVWTDAGRADLVGCIQSAAAIDPNIASLVANRIVVIAENLGETAVGRSSRLPFTYEKAVPGLPYILVFEIVTWTKAGEVIAILHMIDETIDRAAEGPI